LKKFTRCINKFFKQAALNINEIELVAPTGFVRWWAETSPSRFAAWPFATSEHGPNPPYINVKQENLYLAAIQALPFFADWLHGDTNTYLPLPPRGASLPRADALVGLRERRGSEGEIRSYHIDAIGIRYVE